MANVRLRFDWEYSVTNIYIFCPPHPTRLEGEGGASNIFVSACHFDYFARVFVDISFEKKFPFFLGILNRYTAGMVSSLSAGYVLEIRGFCLDNLLRLNTRLAIFMQFCKKLDNA